MFTRPRRFKYSSLYHLIRLSPLLLAFIFGFCTAILFQSLFSQNNRTGETSSSFSQGKIVTPSSATQSLLQHKAFKHEEFLIITILSSPKNIKNRNAIRETWLKLGGTHRRFQTFFVVGTFGLSSEVVGHLEEEQNGYKDMLLLDDLKDSYHTLTEKLLKSFLWLKNESFTFDYLLKLDDDSFVRLDNLYDELVSKDTQLTASAREAGLYWGYFDGRAPVKRTGLWSESDWFLCDRYLPYALGGGYIVSKNLIDFITSNWKHLKFYKNEDISLGSWLASLKVNRIHDVRFDTEYTSRGCIESYLIQHKQAPPDMRTKFDSLDQFQKLCHNGEIEHRLSYEYNWHVPPSKCCTRNVTLSNV